MTNPDTFAASPFAPVVRTVTVRATPERAFGIFTSGMTRWWPDTHSVRTTEAAIAEVVLEPCATACAERQNL